MKHYNVVAAVIINDKKILCVQRGKTKFPYTSYKYEFPGGKIEQGETPQEALHREIIEELKYDITIKEDIVTVTHDYPDFSITMTAFLCEAANRSFTLTEHINAEWLDKRQLDALDWSAADIPIVKAVKQIQSL